MAMCLARETKLRASAHKSITRVGPVLGGSDFDRFLAQRHNSYPRFSVSRAGMVVPYQRPEPMLRQYTIQIFKPQERGSV